MVGEAHPTRGLGIIAYDQASIGMQLGREGDQVRRSCVLSAAFILFIAVLKCHSITDIPNIFACK